MRINKNFNVKGQHITCTDDTRIIKGNKNLYYAVFHVDELWDDIDAKACFTVDEEPYIMPLNRVGNTLECEIPYPANSGIVFGVGIFGGDLISTDIVYTSTTPGIPIDGANPPEPIPDWFNKMEDIARNAMETANSVKEQADSGAFKGDPFTYDDFTNEQLAGLKGEPGYTPQKGVDYFDGSDGHTPQKGVDYFTAAEIAEIVMAAAAEAAESITETDPTVPAWAKASEKPTYTADEVGARPSTWLPSASEVGADPAGTAASAVSGHNTAENAHSDIRLLIAGLTTRLNALADSDDETLDQVSELVAYIKANRELIESVTTGKVSVSDIVDNLTTNVANKPLSAAQGVALKKLIDAITVPTKVSQLENDSGYLKEHQDISGKANASDLDNETTSRKNADDVLSARMDAFTSLAEGSTTGDAELIDARIDCKGKTWTNAGDHIRGITKKIIDACCDEVVISDDNYNLLKASEIVYNSKLEDGSSNIALSNTNNVVTGIIPVKYGQYYTASCLYNGNRITCHGDTTTSAMVVRILGIKKDGTFVLAATVSNSDAVTVYRKASDSTYLISNPDVVALRLQVNIGADISTEEKFKSYQFMFVEGDTADQAYERALNLEYIDGDLNLTKAEYQLKHDASKADKADIESIKSDISVTNRRIINASQKYDGNFIPNDRFIRSIANLRDATNAKEFEIQITNNSGKTIKNAAIAVGLHLSLIHI